jgi:hypothetical protein
LLFHKKSSNTKKKGEEIQFEFESDSIVGIVPSFRCCCLFRLPDGPWISAACFFRHFVRLKIGNSMKNKNKKSFFLLPILKPNLNEEKGENEFD